MNQKPKKIVIGILATFIVFAIGIFTLNYYIKNKIENEIAHLANTLKIEYKAIKVNSLTGTLRFMSPKVSVYGKTTSNIILKAEIEHFTIDDVSYWEYLFNDKITIKNIIFNQPNITYYHNDLVKSESYNSGFKKAFKKEIGIKSIKIINGTIKIFDVATDSILLHTEKIDVQISAVQINKKTHFSYKDFGFSAKNLFYPLNAFDQLFVERITLNSTASKLETIKIKTKYTKEQLSKMLSKERDYFDLTIDRFTRCKKPRFRF